MTWTTILYHPTVADRFAAALKEAGHTDPVVIARNREELIELLPQAQVAFTWGIPPGVLAEHGQHLLWLQNMGAGIDSLLAEPLPPNLIITRVIDHFGPMMSEYVMAMLLAHTQRFRQAWQQQQDQVWKQYRTGTWEGKRLGIAGIGEIGQVTARYAKAFGMEVWGLARTPGARPHIDRVFTTDERLAFCAGLDALVLILPLTPETRGLFGAAEFAALPRGAYFINVGRGAVTDEQALIAALQSGHLSGAALDVFEQEPLPPGHPFWTMPNVTVTPHVSGITRPEGACRQFRENYKRLQAGKPLLGVVDLDRGY